MTDAPDLPTISHVQALPGQKCRLTLDSGEVVTLTLQDTPRASFMPDTPYGPLIRVDSLSADSPAYRVPASLTDAVHFAFDNAHKPRHIEVLEQQRAALPTLPVMDDFYLLPNGYRVEASAQTGDPFTWSATYPLTAQLAHLPRTVSPDALVVTVCGEGFSDTYSLPTNTREGRALAVKLFGAEVL